LKKLVVFCVASFLAAAAPAGAHAQMWNPGWQYVPDPGVMNVVLSGAALEVGQKVVEKSAGKRRSDAAGGAPGGAKGKRSGLAPGSLGGAYDIPLTYEPDPRVASEVKEAFIAKLAEQYPDQAAAIRRELNAVDIPRFYRKIAQNAGYDFRNVGHTYAAYFVTGWIVSNGRDTNRAQEQAALADILPAIVSTEGLDNAVVRQQMDEELMIYIVLLGDAFTQAQRRGPSALSAFSDQAHALFKEKLGVDFRTLTLTADGFQKI